MLHYGFLWEYFGWDSREEEVKSQRNLVESLVTSLVNIFRIREMFLLGIHDLTVLQLGNCIYHLPYFLDPNIKHLLPA